MFWFRRLLANYWFYAVVILTIVGVLSLLQTTFLYRAEQNSPLAANAPRVVMHDVHIRTFDVDGSLESSMHAEGLAQFVDSRLSAVEPEIVLYSNAIAQLFISSKRVDIRDQDMEFREQVHLQLPSSTDIYVGDMRTDQLNYNRRDNQVDTSKMNAKYISTDFIGKVDANAMHMDISNQTIRFHGKVITQITPQTGASQRQ